MLGGLDFHSVARRALFTRERITLIPDAAYDLSGNTLASFLLLNQTGTISVTASKELDAIRWEQTFTVNSGANASLAHFELTSGAGSHSTSNLYGVIGAVHNAGPGTTKALYGRAIADAGCTGVVMGGIMAAETRAGVNTATCLQMTADSADATALTHFIWGSKNSAGTLSATYGVLFDGQVSFDGAAFQAFAVGAGDFLKLKNAAGSADIFRVLPTGAVVSAGDILGNTLTASSAANGVVISNAAVTRTAATGVLSIVAGANGKLILDANSGDIQWNKALVALGGGAAPTFGTIGGSGPASAGQNTWLRFLDSAGVAAWLPVWK